MLNKIRKLREKKGFTLVELIVVIAIIAILTAVIVPLVGRYSAQATYATLQDTAKSISNTMNNVISEVTMMGKTFSTSPVTGKKTNGELTVTVNSKTGKEGDTISSTTDDDTKVAIKLAEALNSTLRDNCQFTIEIGNNTVKGVIYVNDTTSSLPAKSTDVTGNVIITKLKSYENAYKLGSASTGVDIGVDGSYVSKKTDET